MAKLGVSEDVLNNPQVELLPIEEMRTVGGIDKMVKCEYIAQINSTKISNTKKDGAEQMVATVGIERADGVIYMDDYFSYKKPFVERLATLAKMLGLDFANLDSDDFLSKYVWITIKHDKFTRTDGSVVESNKVGEYIRPTTKEELEAHGLLTF